MGDIAPAPHGAASSSGDLPLYRIAYEQSLRALAEQTDELNGIRGRAAQYLAFVGAATAFLVGTGLGADARSGGFYALALLATASSVLAILSVVMLLRPGAAEWQVELSAEKLIAHWIEREVPRPSEADFLRALSLLQDKMRKSNEQVLTGLRRWYMTTLISGGAGILLWASVVWAYR